MVDSSEVHPADVAVLACAEAFRGDGEIFASGMGTIPLLGSRLARATFEPDLLVSDGIAFFVDGELPLGSQNRQIEGWIPFRSVFDTLWGGRRHVIMGASQIDGSGNTNIANIGDWHRPKVQLLGMRGGPGNTINHAVSYWIPKQSQRVFVEAVDMVSGIGYDRAASLSPWVRQNHRIPRVVTNLAVLDFDNDDNRMQIQSVHPWSSVAEVVDATGFELVVPDEVPISRSPDTAELDALNRLDPKGVRHREVSV